MCCADGWNAWHRDGNTNELLQFGFLHSTAGGWPDDFVLWCSRSASTLLTLARLISSHQCCKRTCDSEPLRRLNDQPGFTSSGAETLLDRYEGLWYNCEFVIEGTVSGVNIERRNCTAMADLVDGVSRPASITTAQAFTWISVSC